MTNITVAHTRDRFTKHIWCGLAYLGAVERNHVVLVPHLRDHYDTIVEKMPPQFQKPLAPAGRLPSERDLPEEFRKSLQAKKAAPTKKTVNQTK